jgi:hypothetical protein
MLKRLILKWLASELQKFVAVEIRALLAEARRLEAQAKVPIRHYIPPTVGATKAPNPVEPTPKAKDSHGI